MGLAAVGHVRGATPGPAGTVAVFRDRAGPVSGSRRYCGRDFLPTELDRIRSLIAQTDPPLSRHAHLAPVEDDCQLPGAVDDLLQHGVDLPLPCVGALQLH